MDVSALLRAVWQFKVTSLLIIVLTVVAGGAVLKLAPPVYTATSSYLLIAPPAPPTSDDLKAHPELLHVNYDNPYNRYGTTGVILEVIARAATSDQERQQVVAAGGDARYDVAPEATFGAGTSILDIKVTGDSSGEVLRTLDMVSKAVVQDLYQVQADAKVDRDWMFTTHLIEKPANAAPVYSSTMRAAAGVLVLGGIVLIGALSLRMGAASRRAARREPRHPKGDLASAPQAEAPADLDSRRGTDVRGRAKRYRSASL